MPRISALPLLFLVPAAAAGQAAFDCATPDPPQPGVWNVLGNGSPGSVSTAQLQAALNAGGAIRLDIGASTLVVNPELMITRETVLDVNGATLSGGGARRVLHVTNPNNLTYSFTLMNATITGGSTPSASGAGLWKPSVGPWQVIAIRIFDSTFIDNHAIQVAQDDGGGAIYSIGASELTLVRTAIVGNSGANGGGVYGLGTRNLHFFDSVLEGNSATGSGGNPGNGGNGGGLGVDGAERNINLCRTDLIDNTANAYGAGLFTVAYDQQSFVRLRDCTVRGNNSTGGTNAHTGGVYHQGGPIEIFGCTFRNNQAAGNGALALFDHGGTQGSGSIVNSTFVGNLARTSLGGAINVSASGGVLIQNVTIADNSAPCAVCFAAGINNANGVPLTLRNVLFRNNIGGNAFNPWTLRVSPVSGSHNIQWPQVRPGSGGQQELPVTAGALFADVALGPPADNGGLTETLALPAGSAAVNAGTGTGAPSRDQRGVARSGQVDIGAFELNPDLVFYDGFE